VRARIESLHSQTVDYLEGLIEGFVAYDAGWGLGSTARCWPPYAKPWPANSGCRMTPCRR
jgi:hypothetical protein